MPSAGMAEQESTMFGTKPFLSSGTAFVHGGWQSESVFIPNEGNRMLSEPTIIDLVKTGTPRWMADVFASYKSGTGVMR